MKAEGFKPDTVYELNDEDELLYGGDQTPASMASVSKHIYIFYVSIISLKSIKSELDSNTEIYIVHKHVYRRIQ